MRWVKLCFYCNKPKTDRVYTCAQGARIDLHSQCIKPLQSLVKTQLFELVEKRKK